MARNSFHTSHKNLTNQNVIYDYCKQDSVLVEGKNRTISNQFGDRIIIEMGKNMLN